MNIFKSPDNFERLIQSVSVKFPPILGDASEDFVRHLRRFAAHTRAMKDLSMDDISPIEEETIIADVELQKGAMDPDQAMNKPFVDHLNKADNIESVDEEEEESRSKKLSCVSYKNIHNCPDSMNLTHELLNKLVILRLNGGLGTSMGCKGPKSVVEVRGSLSFLDLAVKQVEYLNAKHGVDVPLVLMNSFNTDKETKRLLSRYDERHVTIRTFVQSCYPLLDRSTLQPIPSGKYSKQNKEYYYPPGHGDVYGSLARCGLLKQLIEMGKEYIFISNIDNLGGTVDLNILYHLMLNEHSFCMEVTKRERQDVSGGTLVKHKGRPVLLENRALPQVLGDEIRRDSRFNKFNTNNLWLKLRELQKIISISKLPALNVSVRQKQIIDSNREETESLGFETAAGAAINLFENSCVVVVSRNRFLPVKTTSDLFAVQSDLFEVKHGALTLSEKRIISPPVPTVKLGPCFRTLADYHERLPFGVPNLIELEHLTVSGDVHFRNHVVLKGTVIIVAEEGSHIDICSGSVIRDKVVQGNLRILDH